MTDKLEIFKPEMFEAGFGFTKVDRQYKDSQIDDELGYWVVERAAEIANAKLQDPEFRKKFEKLK